MDKKSTALISPNTFFISGVFSFFWDSEITLPQSIFKNLNCFLLEVLYTYPFFCSQEKDPIRLNFETNRFSFFAFYHVNGIWYTLINLQRDIFTQDYFYQ